MPRIILPNFRPSLLGLFVLFLGLMGCSASQPSRPAKAPAMPQIHLDDDASKAHPAKTTGNSATGSVNTQMPYPVMLGIDVLEQQGFDTVKGKRIGLLTHPAGVNRRGERTIDVLHRTPGVKLVALYGPEHGINGDILREVIVANSTDKRTGLPVFSVYGKDRKPTKQMLKGIDAMVIDLQDIGTRSYTYISAMRMTMEACFENNIEVIVLDRPNPLGGLKVDGPPLDPQWTSYVGAFRVPYVHGLTIGELAKMAKEAPGVLEVPDAVREKGRLTVIPMRGWRRSMRWPDTGLKWIPTSPMMPDYPAILGYPMTGLGTYLGGFTSGVGALHPFRGIAHKTLKSELIERELKNFKIPGIKLQRIGDVNPDGKPGTGIYIEITDFDAWRPTELSFYLMKLSCKFEPTNPYLTAPQGKVGGFLRHMGSTAFFEALKRDGAKVDVDSFVKDWQARCKIYQQQAKKYWLYY
ncbi:MAG: DUF1343 domain-containing protein [Opitutaceae bacterium]